MSAAVAPARPHHHHALDTHSHGESCRDNSNTFLEILGKICVVALTIFAAFTNLMYFIPSFIIGVGIGIYNFFQEEQACAHGNLASPCSQGFLEQLTGVKLPALVALVANVATTVCHIDHHDTVFVPIVGISVGAWVGKMAATCTALLYKNFTNQTPVNQVVCRSC